LRADWTCPQAVALQSSFEEVTSCSMGCAWVSKRIRPNIPMMSFDSRTVLRTLRELDGNGLLLLYEVDGKTCPGGEGRVPVGDKQILSPHRSEPDVYPAFNCHPRLHIENASGYARLVSLPPQRNRFGATSGPTGGHVASARSCRSSRSRRRDCGSVPWTPSSLILLERFTAIRARIKEVTGLNASAGISYRKFLAKMASHLNKPNGQAVITPRIEDSIRGLLKVHGLKLGLVHRDQLAAKVEAMLADAPELRVAIEPLLDLPLN
jgi:impB/mucB/samB family